MLAAPRDSLGKQAGKQASKQTGARTDSVRTNSQDRYANISTGNGRMDRRIDQQAERAAATAHCYDNFAFFVDTHHYYRPVALPCSQ